MENRLKITMVMLFVWGMVCAPVVQAAQGPLFGGQESFSAQSSYKQTVADNGCMEERIGALAGNEYAEEETKESFADFAKKTGNKGIFSHSPDFEDKEEINHVQSLVTDSEDKESASQVQPLFICIDNTEIERPDNERAFTLGQAVVMLQQQAGPVLISGSLLSLIFNVKSGNHAVTTKPLLELFVNKFDSRRWVIRQLTDDLFVLIPKRYLIERDSVSTGSQEAELFGGSVDTSLTRLGFNAGAMRVIDAIDADVTDSAIQSYFVSKYKEFKEKAVLERDNDISVLAQQLLGVFQKNTLLVPHNKHKWAIYLTGHGEYAECIANIDIRVPSIDVHGAGVQVGALPQQRSQFQQLLAYMRDNLDMALFLYNSCFAAGIANQMIYGDVNGQSGNVNVQTGVQTYPFPIVTGATTDAVVFINQYMFGKADDGSLQSELRFDLFVQELQKDVTDYTQALGHVFPLVKRPVDVRLPQEVASVPLLRRANSPVFTPVFDKAGGKVITLSKIMAATREKPLIVDNTVKALLLETTHIPFPIIFDKTVENMPSFISMVPEKEAVYTFAEIVLEQALFDAAVFTQLIDYGCKSTKRFIVKSLTSRQGVWQDLIISGMPCMCHPVVYALDKNSNNVIDFMTSAKPAYLSTQQHNDILHAYHDHMKIKIDSMNAQIKSDYESKETQGDENRSYWARKGEKCTYGDLYVLNSAEARCGFEQRMNKAVEAVSTVKHIAACAESVQTVQEKRNNMQALLDSLKFLQGRMVQVQPQQASQEPVSKSFFGKMADKAKALSVGTKEVDEALNAAIGQQNINAVRILLSAQIRPSQKAKDMALLWAATFCNKELVDCLIAAGAFNGAVNDIGDTALHYIAGSCNFDSYSDYVGVLQSLLSIKHNKKAKNKDGDTVLALALEAAENDWSKTGRPAIIVEMLKKAGFQA